MENKDCTQCVHNKSCPKHKKLIRKQKKGITIVNVCNDYREISDIFDAMVK